MKVKNNVKKTWNVINSVLGRKKEEQLFKLRIDGKDINDEVEIANEFNNYFSNVAENLVNKIPTNNSRRKYWEYLRNRNLTIYNLIIVRTYVVLMTRFSSFCVYTRIFTDTYKIFVLHDLEVL